MVAHISFFLASEFNPIICLEAQMGMGHKKILRVGTETWASDAAMNVRCDSAISVADRLTLSLANA